MNRWGIAALWAASLGAASGCAGEVPPASESEADERVGSSASAVIGSGAAEVIVYDNPWQDDGLPREVAVVVSRKNGKPDAAFRLDCGSNNGTFFEAFGFARTLDTFQVPFYDSYDAMIGELELELDTAAGERLPVHTLSCNADPSVTRQQIFQVYRRTDADLSKGEPEYYLRFSGTDLAGNNNAGTIYSVGCLNVLTALSWTAADGSDLEQVSVPINGAVLDTWRAQGIAEREVNCYTATARPLPAARRELPVQPNNQGRGPGAELYRVAYRFNGIAARSAPYLISGGKGYAIDCGSNSDAMKQAFGFSPTATLTDLSTSDPRFTESDPDMQPHLRCTRSVKIFDTSDESPSARYFQLDGSKDLVRFTCSGAAAYFAQGAPAAQSIPKAAVPYLLVNPNTLDATGRVLEIGCNGPSDAERQTVADLFYAVFGREPTAPELDGGIEHYTSLQQAVPPLSAADIASYVTAAFEAAAFNTELGPVVSRALERASQKPATTTDAAGNTISGYLTAKVSGTYGERLRANYTLIKGFVEERTPRLEARLREHYLSTYGFVSGTQDKAFHRAVMEKPDDLPTFEALQRPANSALFANATSLRDVISRAIADGKRANPRRPNLDSGTVYSEETTFFNSDISGDRDNAFKTGLYKRVNDRVKGATPAPRADLISSYNWSFGCDQTPTRNQFGSCPASEGIKWWSDEFYKPANRDANYTRSSIEEGHEGYLKHCATASNGCYYEVEQLVSRACVKAGKSCAGNATWASDVATMFRNDWMPANFQSTLCYVRNNKDPQRDPWLCFYRTHE
ncbi:hypothetical protein [Sorangium sp. So ce131]|uniref:hypothetical protein n=1 Tax=Sorangium sp. So ce131 TaxID=3133282 RepID=UPI003F619BCB